MPEEFSRTTARKRITLPSGSQVDVPVITKLSVVDANDRYWETQFTVDNSGNSSREVHVDPVKSDQGDGAIPVERIDLWPVLDATDRAQETQVSLDNVTGANDNPPRFSTHQQTHVVKYYGVGGNTGVWIESELIDELRVIDPNDRHQETWLRLDNPATSEEAQADPGDPEISDSENGCDPPWRTDPFQNLIGYHDENTGSGYPPPGMTLCVIAAGQSGTTNFVSFQSYAASGGQGGALLSFPYPHGATGFGDGTPLFWSGINPSTIDMMTMNGALRTGVGFWGIQTGLAPIIGPSAFISSNTLSGTIINTAPDSYPQDYSGLTFTPYQDGGTGALPGDFLQYYPTIITGQTGWKYVPDIEATYGPAMFTDAVGHIWLRWRVEPIF